MSDLVSCSSACGARILRAELYLRGWSRLPLTGRLRCPACRQALASVNGYYPPQNLDLPLDTLDSRPDNTPIDTLLGPVHVFP